MSDPREIVEILSIVVFFLLIFSAAVWAYWGYYRLNELVSYLPNCKAVGYQSCMSDLSFRRRVKAVGIIISILKNSKPLLRDGGADQRDIDVFPRGIKRSLIILDVFTSFVILALFAIGAVNGYISDRVQEFERWGILYVVAWVLVTVASWAHLAFFKVNEIIGNLPNCKAIRNRLIYLEDGYLGRMNIVGTAARIVIMPKSFLREGNADKRDIDAFPKALKYRLLMSYVFSMVMLVNFAAATLMMHR